MQASGLPLIGIFGGTFDPIHYGHLRVAEEITELAGLQEMRFIPAGIPRLRPSPAAEAQHRIAMVGSAIQDNSGFILDEREIRGSEESRSLNSLRELKRDLGDGAILCIVTGADAFMRLPKWYRWRDLFGLCHFIIAARPGHPLTILRDSLPSELKEECAPRWVSTEDCLKHASSGLVFIAPTTLLDISATIIRARIAAGKSARYLVPDTVLDYIAANQLYLEKR